MMKFMDAITDKPRWEEKVFDELIGGKWKEEAAAMEGAMIVGSVFEWCIDELREKAKEFGVNGFVKALDSQSGCAKSDNLIEGTLKSELLGAVKGLMATGEKDWHPGSGEQVLNLVHPSLYPLVYGRTKALKTGRVGLKNCLENESDGEVVPAGQTTEKTRPGMGYSHTQDNEGLWSTKFQWLPCEVEFQGGTGTEVSITSYINNLHPQEHKPLYGVMEKLISKAIPLWDNLLFRNYEGRIPLRIPCSKAEFDPP